MSENTSQESKRTYILENREEKIDIDFKKYITLDIDDTGQEDRKKHSSNTDVAIEEVKHEIGQEGKQEGKGNLEDKRPRVKPRTITWVYFQLQDATQSQIPPTGDPLQYDPESRNGFVRMVFTIVFIMLAITFGFSMLVRYVEMLNDIFSDNMISLIIMISAAVVMFAMHYVMFCSECSRKPPCNYICLVIVTVAMSLIVAVVTVRYKIEMIGIAVGITAAVVLFCLCLACTSFDFTKYMLYFVVIAFAFSIIALVVVIGMKVLNMYFKPLHIAILVISTLISVIGLIMELQMILGGKTVELGEEDYALGAYMLYTSIVQIFLQILRLLNLLGVEI